MKTNIISGLIACAVVALAIGGVRADEWTDPDTGYTWTYQIVDGMADIGNGYSLALSPSPAGSLTIPSVVDGCVVTGIRGYAFRGCGDLTSVSIPASVTSIDSFAFLDCMSLTDISVAARNQNYKSTGGMLLTKDGTQIVAVPQGRTWVSIPDSVESVSSWVFNSYCPNLNFSWNNGVKSIDGWVIGCDEDDLPRNLLLSGYRGIADGAFDDCHSLTGVTIGEGIKAIGSNAFGSCYNLASLSIPASVKRIGEDAFYSYNLKAISLAKNERDGWRLSYAENAKAAALTVTLNADGSTKIAGKLGFPNASGKTETINVSASGYADVTSLSEGVILADFAPVVSIKDAKATLKKALSIRANLWFDRSNDHAEGVGSAKLVEGD